MIYCSYLNTPTESFNINSYISFNTNSTRSGSHLKLCHPRTLSTTHYHFYFNQIVRLWNHMPVIDLSLPSHVIKRKLTKYLWNHFTLNFNSDQFCTYHYLCPCYRCSRQPISSNFSPLWLLHLTFIVQFKKIFTVYLMLCMYTVLSGCGHRLPTDLRSRFFCFVKH